MVNPYAGRWALLQSMVPQGADEMIPPLLDMGLNHFEDHSQTEGQEYH